MTDLWKKLNLSTQTEIVVLGSPSTFEPALDALSGRVTVGRKLPAKAGVHYVLGFLTQRAEIDTMARRLGTQAVGDALIWIAYPKGTSKRYTCDFNRDSGWEPMGKAGFEVVRQVAIDEDWSALRFRRVEYVKSMTRERKRRQR